MPGNVQATRPQSSSSIITLKPVEDNDLANPDIQLFNLFAQDTTTSEEQFNNNLDSTANNGPIFTEASKPLLAEIINTQIGINPPNPPEFIRPIEPPIRIDPTLREIKELTARLKAIFKLIYGERPPPLIFERMPIIKPDYLLQKLYSDLSKYTGKEITPKLMDSIKSFFIAFGKGKASDTNADGKNDYKDLLTIIEKGYFDPIAWSPEDDNSNEGPPPPNPRPIPLLRGEDQTESKAKPEVQVTTETV